MWNALGNMSPHTIQSQVFSVSCYHRNEEIKNKMQIKRWNGVQFNDS